MDIKSYFLSTVEEYDAALEQMQKTLHVSKEFPEQVFQDNYGNFLFESIDFTLDPDLWDNLQQLALKSGDEYVLLSVLEPEPLTYYYKEFGYFNWCKLPVTLTKEDYNKVLNLEPPESPADSLMINSSLIVWASPTGKWAIWCDRGFEVSVIGFNRESFKMVFLSAFPKWVPIESSLVGGWMSYTFPGFETPPEFLEKMKKVYSGNGE
jgi:hypothetical protein